MADFPTISILMPVKDTEQYLAECINSILEQSFLDWELIMVNDHSTDDSEIMMRDAARKDSRIRVMVNGGSGIIPALETAFAQANGKYITRMDSDDVMTPDKLATLYKLLQDSERNALATGAVEYFATGKELQSGYHYYADRLNAHAGNDTQYQDIYYECPIPSPLWMTRKSTLDAIGGITQGYYPEDYDLAFRFYQYKCPINSTSKVLHYWRDHFSRASRNLPQYKDYNYFPLKIKYFIQLDYAKEKKLLLWGAGSKGKAIARLLLQSNINFRWTCNNPRKWQKHIYDVLIEKPSAYPTDEFQIITAVSQPDERRDLNAILGNKGFLLNKSFFNFC